MNTDDNSAVECFFKIDLLSLPCCLHCMQCHRYFFWETSLNPITPSKVVLGQLFVRLNGESDQGVYQC